MSYVIGVLGVTLLAAAWIVQTIKQVTSKTKINIHFAMIYAIGSLLLTIYSISINDNIFLIMNGLAFLLAITNIILAKK